MTGWLTDWLWRQQLTVAGSAGAGTGYQVKVNVYNTVYAGNGVYCMGKANNDFSDIRFTSSDGTTLLSYWLQTKVNGSSAVFWVKVADSLESNVTVYVYYGNPSASSTSDLAGTFVDVVGGVVGAWNLEEANATDPVIDYSGNGNNGSATGTTVVSSPFFAGKNARSFNATAQDRCAISPSATMKLTTAGTWFARVNVTTFPAGQRIMINQEGNYYLFDFTQSGKLRLYLTDTNSATQSVLTDGVQQINTNYAVLAVWQSGSAPKLYINGSLVKTGVAWTFTIKDGSGQNDFLGYHGTQTMDGIMGNVGICNSAVTDSQAIDLTTANYYPDVSLVAGSVLVRKYTYPEPAISTWGNQTQYYPPIVVASWLPKRQPLPKRINRKVAKLLIEFLEMLEEDG